MELTSMKKEYANFKIFLVVTVAILLLALWSDARVDNMDTDPNNLTTNYWIE